MPATSSNPDKPRTGLLARLDTQSGPSPVTPSAAAKTIHTGPLTGEHQETQAEKQHRERYEAIKSKLQDMAVARKKISLRDRHTPELRMSLMEMYEEILAKGKYVLTRREHVAMFEQLLDDLIGFGPLEPLLDDPDVTDILVCGVDKVFVERRGHLELTPQQFNDEEHLKAIIERVVAPLGRRIDESSPMVDARLPDGSRVNAVIPPLAIDGPALTIRKFSFVPLTAQDLINFGTATPEVFEFLGAAVLAGANILVSGGSSSGKTTLLNIMSGYIGPDERIVTIENAAELRLMQAHVVRLETRPPNIEGEGLITARDLVINSLRMRPDRIVVGEVRSSEAIDLLQAMNTGHDGSMGTLHANTASDALSRLETMCLMAGMDLPVKAIREQIASAVDLIVQTARLRDGTRKIVDVAEILGMEGDTITLNSLYDWEQHALDKDGRIIGSLYPTGIEPARVKDRIENAGLYLRPDLFMKHPATSRVTDNPGQQVGQ